MIAPTRKSSWLVPTRHLPSWGDQGSSIHPIQQDDGPRSQKQKVLGPGCSSNPVPPYTSHKYPTIRRSLQLMCWWVQGGPQAIKVKDEQLNAKTFWDRSSFRQWPIPLRVYPLHHIVPASPHTWGCHLQWTFCNQPFRSLGAICTTQQAVYTSPVPHYVVGLV